MFPVGTTSVQCSTQDAAGNASQASFTVTVRDTTRPVLTLPGAITAEATSPAGKAITFTATASDAVTASPTVSYPHRRASCRRDTVGRAPRMRRQRRDWVIRFDHAAEQPPRAGTDGWRRRGKRATTACDSRSKRSGE
jgi:hypothetical protein